ncbi:MAG: hypothetical protein N3E49_05105 [Bacteroidia bacterium]|nr:hypothetical protein [Bacteroidia bacterium]
MDPRRNLISNPKVSMGCRALLATISLLSAQSPYKPLIFGVTPLFPTETWGQISAYFPQSGAAGYSIGAFGAKEYYNRQGTLGWFVFFQAISWSLRTKSILDGLLPPLPNDSTDIRNLRLPFSNVGGLGLIYRFHLSSKWHITLPADLRIHYISYPVWNINRPSEGEYLILIESNSFIGIGISPTLWLRLAEEKRTFLGLGLSYPLTWGRPAYYTVTSRSIAGDTRSETGSYYLPPRYVEVRVLAAFQP